MVRDARATREQIIQAADALFYGEGIRSASMDAIAARAGVTKRTLYYHFASKDDLIGLISQHAMSRHSPARLPGWTRPRVIYLSKSSDCSKGWLGRQSCRAGRDADFYVLLQSWRGLQATRH
jgi:hypothetical protein